MAFLAYWGDSLAHFRWGRKRPWRGMAERRHLARSGRGRAAVALCGCHDNRVDKMWWNEQWMGYPIGPWYAENSNVTHAHRRAVLRRHIPLSDAHALGQASPRITLHQKFPLDLERHSCTKTSNLSHQNLPGSKPFPILTAQCTSTFKYDDIFINRALGQVQLRRNCA